MPFRDIIGPFAQPARKIQLEDEPPPPKKKASKLGCDNCPLNTVPGIRKIFGAVTGQDIFIWAQSPGPQENREKKELIGPSGDFLWAELNRVGIKRSMCDIQNVVRCFPADRDETSYPELKMRNPSKEELKCCSIYNQQAIEQSKAKIHLIFGELAQKQVLGVEYKKGRKAFWSDRLNGYAVSLYHPSYFLRMGYRVGSGLAPNSQLKQFRNDLNYAVSLLDQRGGKYSYLEEMDYVGVTNKVAADQAYDEICKVSKKGRRTAIDIEYGVLEDGREALLAIGFCPEVGVTYVFALDHTEGLEMTNGDRQYNWMVVKKLLDDATIKKVFHHGSSDVGFLKWAGIEVNGYDYDTEFGAYFQNPDAKAYGLLAIADRSFPELSSYKSIIAPEAFTETFLNSLPKKSKLTLEKKFDVAKRKGALNHAQVPWKKMVLYNGADTDLTKRVEVLTKKSVNLPLMHIYRDSGLLMARMEEDGPLFDYRQYDKLLVLYPYKVKLWRRKLRKVARKEKFNPAATAQAKWLIFRKLGLEMPGEGEETTRAEVLELMKDQHPAVEWLLNFRKDAKILSTYLEGFKISADMHEGRLATKWWLTGTGTGRLSSGAGRDKDAKLKGLVNLQNVISNHDLQNMLNSDLRWRELYKCWKTDGEFTDKSVEEFDDLDVLLGFDQAQFEIRVVAQRSGDKELIKVFERGEDIHASVGNQLMGLPIEKLKQEGPERVAVKAMHFGIIYGLQAAGLHAHICREYKNRGITDLPTVEWVKNLLVSYFKKYFKVREMIEGDHRLAETKGYVETMFGMRRLINVEMQKQMGDEWEGAYWKNQAANTPIQGTAHQLLLLGLVSLIREEKKYLVLQRPVMEVHDAMYFKVKLKDLWKGVSLGTEMLEKDAIRRARDEFGIDWKVPLSVEPKAGFRFGVQCYKLGGKGPKTTAEFLNSWCKSNRETELKLREELEKIR